MSDNAPFGLRPWPPEGSNKAPTTVADFIARSNTELDGGFRSFRRETVGLNTKNPAKRDGDGEDIDMDKDGLEEDDDDSDDVEEEEEEEEKDPNMARGEIIQKLDTAHKSASEMLNLISLLLTKEEPNTAGSTLAPELRDLVGIGTLGSTKLQDSIITTERLQHDTRVILGLKLHDIDRVQNSAATVAGSLARQVEKEKRFWQSIVSVSEAGWAICRLPHDRQTLGVRFGFTEAGGQFKGANVAPLRRGDDGEALLDLGKVGGGSKRLRVSVFDTEGNMIGQSHVSNSLPTDATLGEQVLEARNTIFAQELWHELLLESRTLLSYNVTREPDAISYVSPTGQKLVLELVSTADKAGNDTEIPQQTVLPHNDRADAIAITLSLLLSYAHRRSELDRSRPAPPTQAPRRTLANQDLLRPIIARDIYRQSLVETTQYVGSLVRMLRAAGFPDARFTVLASPHRVAEERMPHVARQERTTLAHAYVKNMLQPMHSQVRLFLTKHNRLLILGRTYLYPVVTAMYQIAVNETSANNRNFLAAMFPHSPAVNNQYTRQADLRHVLDLAVTFAVTQCCEEALVEEDEKRHGPSESNRSRWTRTLDNTGVLRLDDPSMQVVVGVEEGPKLVVRFVRNEDGGGGVEEAVSGEAMLVEEPEDKKPEGLGKNPLGPVKVEAGEDQDSADSGGSRGIIRAWWSGRDVETRSVEDCCRDLVNGTLV